MRHRAPRSFKLPIPVHLPAPVHRKRAAGVAAAVLGLGTVTGVALANQGGDAPAEDLSASDISLAPGTAAATGSSGPSADGTASRGVPTSRGASRTALPHTTPPQPGPTAESPGGSIVNPRVPSARVSVSARVGDGGLTASASTAPSTRASGSPKASGSSSPSGSASSSGTPSGSPSTSGSPSAADTTAPETRAVSVATVGGSWTVALTADERATFECSLDGGAYQPCGAAVTYRDLGSGWHTFAARATDTAGNTDPSPVELTTKVTGSGSGTP